MFANSNGLYVLPNSFVKMGGYFYNEELESLVRLEDTNIVNDMEQYLANMDQFGIMNVSANYLNDEKTGVILLPASHCTVGSPHEDYNYYPLYTDKKFQVNYQGASGMVISAQSEKVERVLTFFEYLYSNKEAYDLVTYGIQGVNYDIENGEYKLTKKPVRLFPIFNERFLPSWSASFDYKNIFESYMKTIYVPKVEETLYNDYSKLKQYRDILLNRNDKFGINERDEIIAEFIQNNGEDNWKKFNTMIQSLKEATDHSNEINKVLQEILSKK